MTAHQSPPDDEPERDEAHPNLEAAAAEPEPEPEPKPAAKAPRTESIPPPSDPAEPATDAEPKPPKLSGGLLGRIRRKLRR